MDLIEKMNIKASGRIICLMGRGRRIGLRIIALNIFIEESTPKAKSKAKDFIKVQMGVNTMVHSEMTRSLVKEKWNGPVAIHFKERGKMDKC